jgi:hypothetical protein
MKEYGLMGNGNYQELVVMRSFEVMNQMALVPGSRNVAVCASLAAGPPKRLSVTAVRR